MTFAEFHAAVAEYARGRHFSAKVEASTSSSDYGKPTTTVDWQAYVSGIGWTREYGTPEEALAELIETRLRQTRLEDVGDVPAATVEQAELVI
jgi:hypothetical protein